MWKQRNGQSLTRCQSSLAAKFHTITSLVLIKHSPWGNFTSGIRDTTFHRGQCLIGHRLPATKQRSLNEIARDDPIPDDHRGETQKFTRSLAYGDVNIPPDCQRKAAVVASVRGEESAGVCGREYKRSGHEEFMPDLRHRFILWLRYLNRVLRRIPFFPRLIIALTFHFTCATRRPQAPPGEPAAFSSAIQPGYALCARRPRNTR